MRAEELIYSTLGGLVNGNCRPLVTHQQETAVPRIAYDVSRNDDEIICKEHPRENVSVILELTHESFDKARALRDQVVSAIKSLANYREKEFDNCDPDPETKCFVWTLTFTLHTDIS